MDKTNNIPTLTTIGIDRLTSKLIDKLCKRYSMKKGEIVRLAFVYIDKACINPSEAPESVKSELAKINKRQDDITAWWSSTAPHLAETALPCGSARFAKWSKRELDKSCSSLLPCGAKPSALMGYIRNHL